MCLTQPAPRGRVTQVLFSEAQIAERVRELGAELAKHYGDKRPLLVGVLSGCFPFLADLARAMPIDLDVDFISVSSYGDKTSSSGVVRLLKDLNGPIEGRHVVLVEDIVDTGLTLKYLLENLRTRGPASVEIVAMLDKAQARKESVTPKWRGFECPEAFVVGYGLDYAGLHRNLPHVGVLEIDEPS